MPEHSEELDAVDDDIVQRLRDLAAWAPDDEPDEGFALAAEAADVIERLRELLYQALTEGGIPPADYAVSLNHDTGQAFLLFGSREARDA